MIKVERYYILCKRDYYFSDMFKYSLINITKRQ